MPNKSYHPSKLSPADVNEIVRLYRENSSISACSLSTQYSCSNVVISKCLRRHIPPDEYARLKLLRNPTHPGIDAVAYRRQELEKRRLERLNRVNHNRFSGQIGPAEAYWVGFLLADGCVYNHRICLELQQKDKIHLLQFQAWVGALFYKVRDVPQNRSCSLRFVSHQMTADLSRYGVVPRKSLTPDFAKDIPFEVRLHYLRGVFDGDGSVHVDQRGRVIAQIAGSYTFCEQLLAFMEQHGVKGIGPYAQKRSDVCSVQFQSDRAIEFLRAIYTGSTKETRLSRKYEIVERLLEIA